MPEIHLFDCTADVWEMIIPFIIQMNEGSAGGVGGTGIYRSQSAFPAPQKRGQENRIYETISVRFPPSSPTLGHES